MPLMQHNRDPEVINRRVRIFRAVMSGDTLSKVGELEGISAPRVRQIFNRLRRNLLHPRIAGGMDIPGEWLIKDIRENASVWEHLLTKYVELNKQHGAV